MRSKTINGYLVINWKEEKHRTRKSEPDDLGPYEISTPLEIDQELLPSGAMVRGEMARVSDVGDGFSQ